MKLRGAYRLRVWTASGLLERAGTLECERYPGRLGRCIVSGQAPRPLAQSSCGTLGPIDVVSPAAGNSG